MIVKVIVLHGLFHVVKGFGRCFPCFHTALVEDFIDAGDILFPFFSFGADGGKFFLEYFIEKFLYLYVAQPASGIMGFQFFQICIFRKASR